jgi:hypothetical protein
VNDEAECFELLEVATNGDCRDLECRRERMCGESTVTFEQRHDLRALFRQQFE